MEEDEYKATYNEIAAVRCVFEKALTNNQCKCALSSHFCLADREGYACKSSENATICIDYLEKVRENSRFLLKLQNTNDPLPHNMEIRVQTGGMQGLSKALYPENDKVLVDNISAVLQLAIEQYNHLDDLPYSEIIKSVAEFKVRKRRKQ